MSDEEDIVLSELNDDELVDQMFDDLYDGLKEEIEEGTNILLERGWTPYDILTKADGEGNVVKTIRIRACDYQVVGIEITNPEGTETVQVRMDRYAATEQGLSVPTIIEAEHRTEGEVDAKLRVELRNVKRFEMKPKQERLFARPPEDHYEEVYRLASTCDFVLVGK